MLKKIEYLSLPNYSIGLFRILLGISLLCNLVFIKLPYATQFYGGNPIIPIPVFQALNGSHSFSIFDLIRHDFFAYGFIGLGMIAALALTVGYQARYAAWVGLFIYWNLLQASSKFIFGFDFYTFQMLFWACFLPLDNAFAIRKNESAPRPHLAVCLVLLYQIAWVYGASGWVKYGESWLGGYAVRNMLMDLWAGKPLGVYLANSPFLYKPITYITLIAECIFPILIFSPFGQKIGRYLAIIFLVGFHVSVLLMYDVANFSLTGLAVAALLLPQHFWIKRGFSIAQPTILTTPSTAKEAAVPPKIRTVWLKYGLYAFIGFSIYIITIKNALFLCRYSAVKENVIVNKLEATLTIIDIPSPIKVSYFTQFWKMFAPNPPVKAGWLALETKKEDGYTYDFFTNKLIVEQPQINWTPKGYEYYLLLYSRNFDFPDNSGSRFKIFLKYWIPYAMRHYQGNTQNIEQLYLTDYLYIVTDQSTPTQPPITFNMYSAAEIVNSQYDVEKDVPIF